jgi:sec-independent protein translocase protein TatB
VSGIGFSELIILALIGLIVLGPERLPRVANQLGGWLGQARRMTRVMKRQLEDELNIEKDLNISPTQTSREPSIQPTYTPPRDDDDFSPAHDANDKGTGVGDGNVDMNDDTDDLAAKSADLPADEQAATTDVEVDPETETETETDAEKVS